MSGSRDLFGNIGAFFAKRGIWTIIADYRLAPEATYPSPVKDVRDAIRFTLASPDVDLKGSGAAMNRAFIFGHSAGGAHATTLFLDEDIMTEQDRSLINGLILLSGMYGSAPHLVLYYGEPVEEMDRKCPLGLLDSKSSEKVCSNSIHNPTANNTYQVAHLFPKKLYLMDCERDDPGFVVWNQTFCDALRDKGVTAYDTYTLMGHNHISPEVSLFSGEGEEWGEEVARWIKA